MLQVFLLCWLSSGITPTVARAQSGPLVDCVCLASLHELRTNACQGVIPDLCALAFPCLVTPVPPLCSQTPPPGGSVGPGNHPITVTFTDFSSGQAVTQICQVTFVVTAPPGGCSNCITPPSGMVGWWPLDELCGATVFADLSGSGNAALVQSGGPVCNPGSPNAIPGKVLGAQFFYGPTVQGRAPNSPSLNFGTNSFSIDGWVNPVNIAGSRQPIVDKLNQTGPSTGLGYALSVLNGALELRVGDGTIYTHNGPTVTFNSWNFVAVAVDRSANTVTFHVNGVTGLPQPMAPAGSFNSTVDLLIGGTHAVNDPYGELAVDELELFNRVLTSAEMTSIWQADISGKCKPTTPCGNSVVSIFCPPDTNVQTCASSAIVNFPAASASTSCGTITNISCNPMSGSSFPLGTTTVTCTATDSQGNSASCTFKVTVTPDLTPPSCPPTSMSVTGCPPLVPNLASNVTDNCTPIGQISIAQNPPAGGVLPPGVTMVTVLACDAASNCVQCAVAVTAVYSGPPPVITCPSNIVTTGYLYCGTNGATVAYPPPQVSNGTLVSCTPSSGSFFPFGITTVTCVATNTCATNICTFTVTVNSGGLIPPCTPPPPNMVMWLKFDETSGPVALNSSAGNNGLLANGPPRSLNQYVVHSLCFNGVNQYVQVTPYPAMKFGTNDFSVDAWVKPAFVGNTVRVIVDHREENGPIVRGYSLFLGAGNTVGFQLADGTFSNYSFPSVVPADGKWHHVAVTVKRTNSQGIRVYVDGVADPNPGNPLSHPGSVTAGPCYPFRVASRSSSVSALFPGCIDEVELFRRALTAAEVQALFDAQCKGKCRISCQAGGFSGFPECWLGTTITNPIVINNPLPYNQTFNWSIQPLPVGPGCNKPGPTFNPSSGTVTVNAYNAAVLFTSVTLPPGFGVGDCSCFRLTISTPDGSQQAICDGAYCLPKILGVCAPPSTEPGLATNLEPGQVTFMLEGSGSSPTIISNPVVTFRSPENDVLGITPLPDFTVPPAGGGQLGVPATFAFPDYDPGRLYSLTLEADVDNTGVLSTLASVPAMNVVPQTETDGPLTIRKGPGGTIIIKWPNPCDTVEINPNLSNPALWAPAPVQTSPWVFDPATNDPALNIRLRK